MNRTNTRFQVQTHIPVLLGHRTTAVQLPVVDRELTQLQLSTACVQCSRLFIVVDQQKLPHHKEINMHSCPRVSFFALYRAMCRTLLLFVHLQVSSRRERLARSLIPPSAIVINDLTMHHPTFFAEGL